MIVARRSQLVFRALAAPTLAAGLVVGVVTSADAEPALAEPMDTLETAVPALRPATGFARTYSLRHATYSTAAKPAKADHHRLPNRGKHATPYQRLLAVPSLIRAFPLRLPGNNLVLNLDKVRLAIGRGASASAHAGAADLSGTPRVRGPISTAGGLLTIDPDTAKLRASAAFDTLDGLGYRSRVRMDAPLGDARLAASVDPYGAADVALAHRASRAGWTTATRGGVAVERKPERTLLAVESSAALRHEPTGWNALLAGGGRSRAADGTTALTLYSKIGKDMQRTGARSAFTVDGGLGHNNTGGEEAAGFVGATALHRWTALRSQFDVRYRYNVVSRGDARTGSHAILVGARIALP